MDASSQSKRASRLARWETHMNCAAGRKARADPAWLAEETKAKRPKQKSVTRPMTAGQRGCTGRSGCSCRTCVLARWERMPTSDPRVARVDISSFSDSSQSESAEVEHSRGPFDFKLFKAVDHFQPIGNVGGNMCVIEAVDLTDGTEATVLLDDFKLSVRETTAEMVIITVSKRLPATSDGTHEYEVVYTSRSRLCQAVPHSIDDLAASFGRERGAAEERGSMSSVWSLLENAAASYGTTVQTLIDSLHRIAPGQIGRSLVELTC